MFPTASCPPTTRIASAGASARATLAALAARRGAVALSRPATGGPQPLFMARWFGGMGLRALALGAVLAIAATHRAALPPLPAALGFLGVLLPLLFLETRFLR